MGKQAKHNKKSKKRQKRSTITLLILLLIVVIGGVIYFFNVKSSDSNKKATDSTRTEQKQSKHSKKKQNKSSHHDSANKDNQKNELTTKAEQLMSDDLSPIGSTTSAYFYDLSSKQSATFGTDKQQRAASDIKLFIMATVYQSVKDGKFYLNEKYALKDTDKVGGSGALQGMASGTQIYYQDLLKYMMTQSDNTASNILLDKVGGISAVNNEIKKLGLTNSVMQRKLMDTKKLTAGQDNMTTAKDLGKFLTKLYHHQVVSETADSEMMRLLLQNTNHSKLPAQVASDVKVYNKTGEFSEYGVQNDAAIMEKGGKAFVIVVLSQNGTEATQHSGMAKLGLDLSRLVFK
ncbi:serine hydrolase [Companilactobacillus furfuricola]|uniref:serine hydrolase n=1 Tax=Companilactobacillus furfuricola TaxID=1462575 RepID=UPI000F7B6427|nr:serine hydrolase [Companilactobacillus furfuricola]